MFDGIPESRVVRIFRSRPRRPTQPLIIKVLQATTGDRFEAGARMGAEMKEAESQIEERYSRQILFPGIGAGGQRRLAAARVAIVGCGATGSALAASLARAGIGKLRIIDRDYVEPSNLQRQSLFDESDATESLPKAIAAARKIAAFNSQIIVEAKVDDLIPANIKALLEGMDLILDGTDNFETRYLINDYAIDLGLPWI